MRTPQGLGAYFCLNILGEYFTLKTMTPPTPRQFRLHLSAKLLPLTSHSGLASGCSGGGGRGTLLLQQLRRDLGLFGLLRPGVLSRTDTAASSHACTK